MDREINICQNCKQTIIISRGDIAFYEKVKVPFPTFCPSCRFQRRLTFRNERVLYLRTCSGTNKRIVSYYDENVSFPVYSQEFWYSDSWDGTTYGRDYNFLKPFFEQFVELGKVAPRIQLWQVNTVNSEYSNYIGDSKNCYLCFTAFGGNENSMYASYLTRSISCFDCDHIANCENCYECFNCDTCYKCRFTIDSTNCRDSGFLSECSNCVDCFGCVGLKNKQYCIWNEQYTKQDYFKTIEALNTSNPKNLAHFLQKLAQMRNRFPKRYMHGSKNQDVTGDYVTGSKNCVDTYFSINGENVSNAFFTIGLKTSMDVVVSTLVNELLYECHAIPKQNYNIKFSELISNGSTNTEYSSNCDSCSNLFGCIGLRKKEFCILNKQYTKEEYEELVPRIRKHMNEMQFIDKVGHIYAYGEFFPSEISPFAYNESLAQQYFPIVRNNAKEYGYVWKDPQKKNYHITLKADAVPDNVSTVTKAITKEVIGCKNNGAGSHNCTTAFRIMPDELIFYIQNNIPIPRYCPNCRHHNRLKYQNSLILRERVCDCLGSISKKGDYQNQCTHSHNMNACGNIFQTTYFGDEFTVYCENCYQQEFM